MNTNDPGREPEPTDAAEQAIEVLRERFEAWYAKESKDYLPGHGKECDAAMKSMALIAWLSGAFLASGARPLPDAPEAPQPAQGEECQHASDLFEQAEVARLKKWQEAALEADAETTVVLLREKSESRKLKVRIADLERENAALRAELADAAEHLCYINRIDTKRPTPDHNRVVDRIRAMATTGKEAPDA